MTDARDPQPEPRRHRIGAVLGDAGRELVRFHPSVGDWRVATRAGLATLLVLGGLVVAGRLDLGLYASFGIFASLYGGRLPTPGRWRIQVRHGLLLTAVIALGAAVATSDARAWLAIPVVAAVAAVASWLSDRQGWSPPGALFPVFAAGASATIPVDWAGVGIAALVAAGAATLSILLGALEQALLPVPHEPRTRPRPDGIGRHAILTAASVLVAGLIATGAQIGHPYWAMLAAVVPFAGRGAAVQLARGAHRLLGTCLGIALAALLLLLELPPIGVVLAVVVLQAAVELVVVRNYGLALVAITPLALVLVHASRPEPIGELLLERVLETAIGVGVALAAVALDRAIRRR